jgi:lysophospholipase L1-like esterase
MLMFRLRAVLAVLAVSAVVFSAAAAVVTTVPAAQAATPVRIMPLGDSITGGPGCWRALLWDRLQRTGFTNIDFVGTIPGGGCNLANWDGDNDGHGGFQATGIANQNQLPGWLAQTHPDIVLMHLGTNDIWGNLPTATILAAYTTLIDQMRASNPAMRILVAQIIPMTPSGCTWCPPGVAALNSAIPGWAAGKSTARSPITVVDQFTGFDSVADTNGDGVHPDDSGFQKISDRWYPALVPLLGGATASSTPSRSSAPGTPSASSASAGGAGACTATLTVQTAWGNGYVMNPNTVTNTGSVTLNGWTVTFILPTGHTLTGSWNATVTVTGQTVTARGIPGQNATLAAGTGTVWGLQASRPDNTTAIPSTATCTSP